MYRRLAVISLQLEELGLTHERNVDVLLRRMAGNQEIAPLKLLASLVEPVKEYHRGQQRPATMLTPLTGLVDAARPDSAASRQFARVVDGFLTDAPRFQLNASFLRLTLTEWRDAEPSLAVLIDRSPALRETKPLAADLGNLGQLDLRLCRTSSEESLRPAVGGHQDLRFFKRQPNQKPRLNFRLLIALRNS